MTIKNQEGASAVEFALIVPLLFILIFGIIEFSILLYNKAMITNASREGARAGIVFALNRPTESEIQTIVDNYATTHLINFDPSQTIITTARHFPGDTPPESAVDIDSGDSLEVTVQYTYDFLVFPNLAELVGGVFANIQNIEAVTIMRYE